MATKARNTGAIKKKPAKRKPAKKKVAAKAKPKAKVTRDLPSGDAKGGGQRTLPELERPETGVSALRAVPSVSASQETLAKRVGAGVRSKDINTFLRQLIMMLDSGTPILKALKSLARRGENRGVRDIVSGIAEHVESGNPLWQSFARETKYFPPVFVNLVKAAEASGTLTTVLRRLTENREQRERLQRYVQVAMIYPAILLTVCAGLIIILSKFVIPAFREIFDTMGAKIGWYSRFIMGAADFISGWYWLGILVIVGLVVAYYSWWIRNPVRRLAADQLKLRLPVFGSILQRSVVAEFMRTFGMLLRSGISMMGTLDLCKNSVSNRAYVSMIQDMRDSVEAGEGFEAPLRQAEKQGYVPGLVVDMILTGEESGSLDRVADQIAESYEEEVEISVNALKEIITPAFVVFMGFIVGSIVIGMFLPLVSMIESIAGGPM